MEDTTVFRKAPTAKERKYDRQLRIWGPLGQRLLEDAHVLLINSGDGGVGVEVLKNLVLPGIGKFTILDDAVVTERDLEINFYVSREHLGQPRGKVNCDLLGDMNPDVTGAYIQESIRTFLENEDALEPFTLIIVAGPIDPVILGSIGVYTKDHWIPLLYIHSIGFYGHFSISIPDAYPVLDTHPDKETTTDLRLLNPWPELLGLMERKTEGLTQMNDHDHGHVPYVLLLLYNIEEWKKTHHGEVPKGYAQKREFRNLLQSRARPHVAGGEENFEEAVNAVMTALEPYELKSGIREIFEAREVQAQLAGTHLDFKTNRTLAISFLKDQSFWYLAVAARVFYDLHGVLPLAGSLPDMKAQSKDYIELQNTYKLKARRDWEQMSEIASQRVDLDRARVSSPDIVISSTPSENQVAQFCRHLATAKVIRGSPMNTRIDHNATNLWDDEKAIARFRTKVQDPESMIHLYIAFIAYDNWLKHGPLTPNPQDSKDTSVALPLALSNHNDDHNGVDDTQIQAQDIFLYAIRILNLLNTSKANDCSWIPKESTDRIAQHIQELVRADGGELHVTSAYIGGVVSQEAVKLITNQFIPADNVFVWDGIASKSEVFKI